MSNNGDRSHEYLTEKQTYDKCRGLIKKYKRRDLAGAMGYWFDGQLDIAKALGIHWHDLYRKDTDLDTLFSEAANG